MPWLARSVPSDCNGYELAGITSLVCAGISLAMMLECTESYGHDMITMIVVGGMIWFALDHFWNSSTDHELAIKEKSQSTRFADGGRLISGALLTIYIFCGLMFFSFHGRGKTSNFIHSVGNPSPWFMVETHADGFRSGIILQSWAWLVLGIGLLAYYLRWRIKRSHGEANARFGIPMWHCALWGLMVMISFTLCLLPLMRANP